MKKLFRNLLFFVVTGLYSCSDTSQTSDNLNSIDTLPKSLPRSFGDTLKIGLLFQSEGRGLGNCYFAVRTNDTSNFKCYVSKSEETGTIGMKLSFSSKMSYRQQMNELALILQVVKADFVQLDSLRSVSIGRLLSTGDLAVEVTHEYLAQNKKIPSTMLVNKEIDEFLLSSKLTRDFNSILKPYSVSINKISTEKDFFADKKSFYLMSKIETDSAKVPSKILDAQVWIGIQADH